jgi:Ice-binding-like
MKSGVPPKYPSPLRDALAASPRRVARAGRKTTRAAVLLAGILTTFIFTSSALGAAASVGLGTAASFSVLGGSTVTNTGPTTMFGDLGLSPGSSVTGAPHVLGQTHVDDAVAVAAKNDLTTAYDDAASRPSNGSAGTDLAGQVFLPGVRTASSSLLLSAGSVTLDAQGNPDAVFIFQIGTTLKTGSNTSVSLVNGAQACNVFWQVGSSATLGTGTSFVGTVMALASITATTAATIHGRLLARNAAVTLDTNTITTSNCASSVSGTGGGAETPNGVPPPGLGGSGSLPPSGSRTVITPSVAAKRAAARRAAARRRAARRRAARRHTAPRVALPHHRSSFTG